MAASDYSAPHAEWSRHTDQTENSLRRETARAFQVVGRTSFAVKLVLGP